MDSVLIVDDNRLVRTMARDALTEVGFIVEEAPDGEAALAALDHHPHNLVLLDIVLPGRSGLELIEEIHARCPETIIVMISGASSTRMAITAMERGAYDYVSKPLRPEELVITVRKALDHYWLSHQRDLLISKLRGKIQRLESFEHLSRVLSSTLEFPRLVDLGLKMAYDLVSAEQYGFVALDPAGRPDRAWMLDEGGDALAEVALAAPPPTLGQALDQGGPLVAPGCPDRRTGPLLVLPLMFGEQAQGVLMIQKGYASSLAPEEQQDARCLASHLAVALHNARATEDLRLSKEQVESYSQNLERMVQERTRALEERTRELEATQDHLVHREKMASIGQLAAGVAHEINNPLAFVSANVEALEEDTEAARQAFRRLLDGSGDTDGSEDRRTVEATLAEILEIARDCREGVTRMARIVRSLKEFSAADQDVPEEADLNTEVENALKLVWNELKYTCRVHKDLQPLPPVLCYPSQLVQVFVNILVNAAQAMPEGGNISLRTRRGEGEAAIEIQDDGTGIEEEVLNRIFDPFFTTKEVGVGTGLGLSVSYGIVEKHGGTIEVDSEPGRGTTFRILIPLEGVGSTRKTGAEPPRLSPAGPRGLPTAPGPAGPSASQPRAGTPAPGSDGRVVGNVDPAQGSDAGVAAGIDGLDP